MLHLLRRRAWSQNHLRVLVKETVMDFDKIDLKNAPDDIKLMICVLGAHGWETVEGGFRVRVDAKAKSAASRLFPEEPVVDDKLTVTGEPAESFMSLYRRAASWPPSIVTDFTAWLENWIEVEAKELVRLRGIHMNGARRDVRLAALSALRVELDKLWNE